MQDQHESHRQAHERSAKALGIFSLALGLFQLAAPAQVVKAIGLRDRSGARWLMRALGAREVVSGLGVLTRPEAAGPLWLRLAGDAADLTLLASCFSDGRNDRTRLLGATAAVAGVAALDALAAAHSSRNATIQRLVQPIHVVRTISINRPPEFIYEFWRRLENLPKFMSHLESVVDEGETSLWRAKALPGMRVEWRAEITLDLPNEAIGWRSVEGASVPNSGVVRFNRRLDGRGTELFIELEYDPPGDALGAAIAKLFGREPGQEIQSDLRRLKQVLETGSVMHSDASIHRGMHPARPAAADESPQIEGGRL